jgi:hypothetical protein
MVNFGKAGLQQVNIKTNIMTFTQDKTGTVLVVGSSIAWAGAPAKGQKHEARQ